MVIVILTIAIIVGLFSIPAIASAAPDVIIRDEDTDDQIDIPAEIRFQKQCFLSTRMVDILTKIGDMGYGVMPEYYTQIYGAASHEITSLFVSRPGAEVLMKIPPMLLTFINPEVRLYKVFQAETLGLSSGVDHEVEFIFDTNFSRDQIADITRAVPGVPGAVSLKSLNWSFLGVNPAEVENNIKATLKMEFSSPQEFERQRGTQGFEQTDDGRTLGNLYRFRDLVVPEPLYNRQGNTDLFRSATDPTTHRLEREYNPDHFKIKISVGWTYNERVFTEEFRNWIANRHSHITSNDIEEAANILKQTRKVMYLNLISHDINITERGTLDLTAEYQAYAEGVFTSNRSNIFGTLDSTREEEIRAGIQQNADMVQAYRRRSEALRTQYNLQEEPAWLQDVPDADLGMAASEDLTIPSRANLGLDATNHMSPRVGGSTDPVLGSSPAIAYARDFLDLEAARRQNVTQNTFYNAQLSVARAASRTHAYESFLRELSATGKIYTIYIDTRSLGFGANFGGLQNADGDSPAGVNEEALTSQVRQAFGDARSSVAGAAGDDATEASSGIDGQTLEFVRRAIAIARIRNDLQFDIDADLLIRHDDDLQRTGAHNLEDHANAMESEAVLLNLLLDDPAQFRERFRPDFEGSNADLVNQYMGGGTRVRRALGVRPVLELNYLERAQRIRNSISHEAPSSTLEGNISLRNRTSTEFMFFGDLLDFFLGNDNVKHWVAGSKVRVVLGTFKYKNIKTGQEHDMPLSYIPISVELFTEWFLEEIIEREITTLTLRQFIRSIFDKLISNSFGGECAYDPDGLIELPQENVTIVPEHYVISWLALRDSGIMPQTGQSTNPRQDLNLGQPNNPGTGIVSYSDVEQEIAEMGHGLLDHGNIVPGTLDKPVNVVVYQGQNEESLMQELYDIDLQRTGGYSEQRILDARRGIYHLQMGSPTGILKNIKYNRMDQDYLRESRIAAAGELGSHAQLRERYNAKVELFGTTLFYPGQFVYLNPSFYQHSTVPTQRSFTTLIGLGGYYLIKKVENIIEGGGWETILDCSWVCSGFRVQRNNIDATLQQNQIEADEQLQRFLEQRQNERQALIQLAQNEDPETPEGHTNAGGSVHLGETRDHRDAHRVRVSNRAEEDGETIREQMARERRELERRRGLRTEGTPTPQ